MDACLVGESRVVNDGMELSMMSNIHWCASLVIRDQDSVFDCRE